MRSRRWIAKDRGICASLHIPGGRGSVARQSLGRREAVTVWGEVADVRPFLAEADIVAAPLTIARGIQNKVLEAMAMARPVLLSPEAATGIDAEDGTHFAASNNLRWHASNLRWTRRLCSKRSLRKVLLDGQDRLSHAQGDGMSPGCSARVHWGAADENEPPR